MNDHSSSQSPVPVHCANCHFFESPAHLCHKQEGEDYELFLMLTTDTSTKPLIHAKSEFRRGVQLPDTGIAVFIGAILTDSETFTAAGTDSDRAEAKGKSRAKENEG